MEQSTEMIKVVRNDPASPTCLKFIEDVPNGSGLGNGMDASTKKFDNRQPIAHVCTHKPGRTMYASLTQLSEGFNTR